MVLLPATSIGRWENSAVCWGKGRDLMNNNEFANLSKPDVDLLMEFEGIDREIARQLLSYRQPASPALRRRVMAITTTPQPRPLSAPRWTVRRAVALIAISLL